MSAKAFVKQIEKLKENYGDPDMMLEIGKKTFPVGHVKKEGGVIVLSQGEKAMRSSDFVKEMEELVSGPDASVAVKFDGKLFLITGIGIKVRDKRIDASCFVALTDMAYKVGRY